MVQTEDILFVAGPLGNPQASRAALEGRAAGKLLAISTKDGSKLAETALPSTPIWDGMAVGDVLTVAAAEADPRMGLGVLGEEAMQRLRLVEARQRFDGEQRSEAKVLCVIRDNQEIERYLQLASHPGTRGDLLPAGKSVGLLRAEGGADKPGVC